MNVAAVELWIVGSLGQGPINSVDALSGDPDQEAGTTLVRLNDLDEGCASEAPASYDVSRGAVGPAA